MNVNNHIGIALDELYRIFEILNKNYFSNSLPYPMITIQKTKKNGNLGWFTLDKVWKRKNTENDKHELNICPEYLTGEIYEVVDTLQHETVHYANRNNDIKDCNGKIHNKKFKSLAESVGLIVTNSKKYGYGHTKCSENFKNFIDETIKPNIECFEYFRTIPIKKEQKEKTIFTYICPQCNEKIKAKVDKKIICGECNCEFEIKL